jgi:hypothetical protein
VLEANRHPVSAAFISAVSLPLKNIVLNTAKASDVKVTLLQKFVANKLHHQIAYLALMSIGLTRQFLSEECFWQSFC